jgi:Zn finger protein HypA/HybF involved in hydrogenase expression
MPLTRKWSDQDLIDAFSNAESISQVIKKLNLALSGGTYENIKKHLDRLNLKFAEDAKSRQIGGIKKHQYNKRYTDKDIFVENSLVSQQTVRTRFLETRVKICCDKCELTDWNGESISFQLDHKNGIRTDNRLENLRLLCPNCHSQTPTFGGKNIRSSGETGNRTGFKLQRRKA